MITPLDPALRTAWLELLAIGLLVAPVGVWALHRRELFTAEVLPHAMLPAAGLAALAGASIEFGGVVGALLGGALILVLGAARETSERDLDAAATTVLGAATGLGTILTIEAAGTRGLERLLFGDPLAATSGSAAVAVAAALLVGAGAIAGHRALLASTLGPDAARAAGVRARRTERLATAALAVAVAVAAASVGALLAFALIAGPAALATRRGRSVGAQIAVAGAAGIVVVTAGLALSANVDVPAGPAVALVAGLPPLTWLLAAR